MKKILLTLTLLGSTLLADTSAGEKVYQKVCASCHIQMMTPAQAQKNLKNMKAPPMNEVSQQLKNNIKIVDDIDDDIHRAVVVAFIKDYVLNPNLDASMCNAGAIEKFGLMPSQKGQLSAQELDDVAKWVYDFYIGKKF